MATITSDDYKWMKAKAYTLGFGKEELQSLPYLPNKTEIWGTFQAIEDWQVGGFLTAPPVETLKNAMITAIGQTINNALCMKFFTVWCYWKIEGIGS